MSLADYLNTYDGISGVIINQSESPGEAKSFLTKLRENIESYDGGEILKNRQLFVEPVQLSQRYGIRLATVEKCIQTLQKMGILHIWARATCPLDEDEIIVETDDSKTFKDAISDTCAYCGQSHKHLPWESIETFYVVNITEDKEQLDLRRFYTPQPKLPALTHNLEQENFSERFSNRIGRAISFFSKGDQRSPQKRDSVEQVVKALESNHNQITVVDFPEIAWRYNRLMICFYALGVLTIVIGYCLIGPLASIVAFVLWFVVILITTNVTKRILFSRSYIPSLIVNSGFTFSSLLLISSLPYNLKISLVENKPWEFVFEDAPTNWGVLVLAFFIILITFFSLVIYQRINRVT